MYRSQFSCGFHALYIINRDWLWKVRLLRYHVCRIAGYMYQKNKELQVAWLCTHVCIHILCSGLEVLLYFCPQLQEDLLRPGHMEPEDKAEVLYI